MKDEDIEAAEKLSAHEDDVGVRKDDRKLLVKHYLGIKRIGAKRLDAIIAHAESVSDCVDLSRMEGSGRLFPRKEPTGVEGSGRLFPRKEPTQENKNEADDNGGKWMGRMLSAHLREQSSEDRGASILLCVCPGCGAELCVGASMKVKL